MLKIEGENPQKDQHQDQTEERMKGKSEVDSSAGDGQVKNVRTKTVFDIHSCPEG